jgi:acyl dehydratase
MKYFEDFASGETEVKDGWPLTEAEIIGFARQWDPQPQHVDPEAAKALPLAGLIAAGTHLLALCVRQMVTGQKRIAVIAAMGWDEVRFLAPARPGDVLTLTRTCLEARASASKSDRGIVRNEITLTNQHGQAVLRFVDAILVRRRPGPAPAPPEPARS